MVEALDANADYNVGARTLKGFDIIAYIGMLKDSYVLLQRRYRPDIRRAGGDDLKWRALAFALLANNCNPNAYMSFAFDYFAQRGNVHPNMVTSVAVAEKYVVEKPEIDDEIKLLIQLQADTVAHHIKTGRTLEQILLDTRLELSTVFRFALAWSEGRFDIAKRFEEDAKRMLVFQPMYRQILWKWLPEGLR